MLCKFDKNICTFVVLGVHALTIMALLGVFSKTEVTDHEYRTDNGVYHVGQVVVFSHCVNCLSIIMLFGYCVKDFNTPSYSKTLTSKVVMAMIVSMQGCTVFFSLFAFISTCIYSDNKCYKVYSPLYLLSLLYVHLAYLGFVTLIVLISINICGCKKSQSTATHEQIPYSIYEDTQDAVWFYFWLSNRWCYLLNTNVSETDEARV